jgi:dolichyl-phosphate-mannose-protein mannosyltransferase
MRQMMGVSLRTVAWRGTLARVLAKLQAIVPFAAHAALAPVAADAPRASQGERDERTVPRIRRVLHFIAQRWNAAAWVALLASVASIASYIYYSQQGLTLAYGDAISHMMIARRILSGLTPGLAQAGTNWLPLNHLLMLPFIWNDVLFHDGFAGTFPSMVAFVIGAVYLFRTGRLLFSSSIAGAIAAGVFILNPNILYMQSTAMTESDTLCLSIVAVYYVLTWVHSDHAADIVKAAIATAAGTLVRYDTWALACALFVFVVYIGWKRRGRVTAEAYGLLFGLLAFAGCVAWLIYNGVIFNDPLFFYHGPYSTQYQQQHIESASGLPTHNNPWLSFLVYGQAVIDTVGWPVLLLAIIGLLVFLMRSRLNTRVLPAYAVLVPFVFNWLALVKGISVLATPEFKLDSTSTYFNERYAMMMIPAVAIFIASFATWPIMRREVLVFILAVSAAFSILNPTLGTPYALQDPLVGANSAWHTATIKAAPHWLTSHYHGGLVLISDGPYIPIGFYSNLSDHDFITSANGKQYRQALAHPQDSVNWIVIDTSTYLGVDPVWVNLSTRQDWRQYFILRQTFGTTQIYERSGQPYSSASPPPATHPTATRSNPFDLPRPVFPRIFPR